MVSLRRDPLRVLLLPLIVAVLFTGLAPASGAEAPGCELPALRARLLERGLPVGAVVAASPGAVVTLVQGRHPSGALWFGFLPTNELATTSRDASLAMGGATTVPPFGDLVRALDADTTLRSCAALRVGALDTGAAQEDVRRVLSAANALGTTSRAPEHSGLALAVHGLCALAILVYLAVLGLLVARTVRRDPREALWALLPAVVALAVRLLSAPRGPIEAANADFTHLVDAAAWLRSGFDIFPGAAYPPAYRLLLTGLFAVFGTSAELAFGVTTALGALTAVPAYLVARRVTGSRLAGVLAGLALAAYPPAVFFSNGVTLAIPAALLLTLAFAHLEALVAEPSRLHALAYALAMLLFVQTRVEALGLALLAVLAHFARVVELRALTRTARVAWAPVLATLAVTLPYVALVARATSADPSRQAALDRLATQAAVVAGAGALTLAAARVLERWSSLRTVVLLAVVGGAGAWVWRLTMGFHGDPFLPVPFTVPEAPFHAFHADLSLWNYVSLGLIHRWTEQPAFLPLPFAALLTLALLPRADGAGPVLAAGGVALLVLPLAGTDLTAFVATGIGLAEGLRLHVPLSGLVAAGIGVGAGRLLAWSRPSRGLLVALAAMLGAVVLSPAVTHRPFLSDSDRDQRAEYLFARDALARLPDGATVILPDQLLDLRPEVGRFAASAELFRTPHLLMALAAAQGRALSILGLRELEMVATPLDEAWFFAGLDCYRAERPQSESRDCELARSLASRAPDAARDVPTRGYTLHSADLLGQPPSLLHFALRRLDAAAQARLLARVGVEDTRARESGLTEARGLP